MGREAVDQREKVREALFAVVDRMNKELPERQRLEPSLETVLIGKGGGLDSLGLVSLLAATEEAVEDACGIHVTLADESAMSSEGMPFRTIGTLVDHIVEKLRGSTHD